MELVHYAGILLTLPPFWHDHGHLSGWWLLWRFGMMFFWLAFFIGLIWWFRRCGHPRERSGTERARDILAERYARGELSGEEYRERLSGLG